MSRLASPYRRGTIVGSALAVAAAVGWGYHVEVVVTAPTERIEATARVPLQEAALPAQTVTRRVTVPTTGGMGTTHATGRVRLSYETDRIACRDQGDCPPPEVVVPAGTRIATCVPLATPCRPDVHFATVRTLRLRETAFDDGVEVRAVEPGSRGNVFTAGPLEVLDQPRIAHARITAFALDAEGGADAPSGTVTQADIDGAVGREQVAVLTEASERLRADAADRDLKVAAPTTDLQVIAEPPVGGAAPEVAVTLTATATGAGYREDQLAAAARRAVAAACPPGRFPVQDDPHLPVARVEDGHAVVDLVAFVSPVDRADVRRRTPGRLTGRADRDLEARLGVPVSIEGRPLGLPFTPVRGSGVKVRVAEPWDEKTHRR